MFLNQSHCSEKFSSHVILETNWGPYRAIRNEDPLWMVRPLLAMAELNAKSAGRAVVLESAETGLGPSEFLVGDAH